MYLVAVLAIVVGLFLLPVVKVDLSFQRINAKFVFLIYPVN